ncbi:GerMN domain-containing protein [Guptibacillus algicola]|uniref:GerMN domain-containing protein n=1 Tax=Guptibacillus algicola TaxID=225844 RepID=UPI001CD42EDB|nr:GerMN domain-containing protein [Alkalihalobacillus algicola]MCA0986259.1 GerMN domain-containing protein [Alkalihalobacillus algicola]
MRLRGAIFTMLLLLCMIIISGCGFGFEKSLKEIDPPKVDYANEGEELDDSNAEAPDTTEETKDGDSEASTNMSNRELYLLDSNGMVVPQTVQLPAVEGAAKQALEYLVIDGPVTEMLPNGFQAVLPAGTMVQGINQVDDTLVVDFSEEFKDYAAEHEKQILEAVTWTLTQFEGVKNVKIQINGHDQTEMPVNGTPIGENVSRSNGINNEMGNVVDVSNSSAVTVYFMAQNNDYTYYVPVTKRIEGVKNDVNGVITGLLEGPPVHSGLFSQFSKDLKLLDSVIKDGLVTLDFNEAILTGSEDMVLEQELLNSLVLSLTENADVKEVAITVDGHEEVVDEAGNIVSEPVSRPVEVNKVGF